jgi:hypothetical protein
MQSCRRTESFIIIQNLTQIIMSLLFFWTRDVYRTFLLQSVYIIKSEKQQSMLSCITADSWSAEQLCKTHDIRQIDVKKLIDDLREDACLVRWFMQLQILSQYSLTAELLYENAEESRSWTVWWEWALWV